MSFLSAATTETNTTYSIIAKGSETRQSEVDQLLLTSLKKPQTIFDHFRIQQQHFSVRQHTGCYTFNGIHEKTLAKVTIRLERLDDKRDTRLRTEVDILTALGDAPNMCQTLYESGELNIADERFFAVVSECLGPNLYQLQSTYKIFDDHTNLMLAHQMLACLLSLHTLGYIHGNLTMLSFGFGVSNKFVVLMLFDYTHCSRYEALDDCFTPVKLRRVPYPLYSSCSVMRGKDQLSPGDDLVAMCYMLVHLYLGRLPWMQLRKQYPDDREYLAKTLAAKEKFVFNRCKVPAPYRFLWEAVQQLNLPDGFNDFKKTFHHIFVNHIKDMGRDIDYRYDWIMKDLPIV